MGALIIIVCWVSALVLAAAATVPRWVAWFSPGALAVVFGVTYATEKSGDGGDPQPGLVRLVVLVSEAVCAGLVVVGLVVRDRRSRR